MSKISALTLTLAAIRKAPHALPINAIKAVLTKNSADLSTTVITTGHSFDMFLGTLYSAGLIAYKNDGFTTSCYIRKPKRAAVDKLISKVNPNRLTVTAPVIEQTRKFSQNKSAELVILATIRKAAHAVHGEALRFMLEEKFDLDTAQDVWSYINNLVTAGLIKPSAKNDQCFFVPKSKRAFVDSIINKVKLPTIEADTTPTGEELLAKALSGGDNREVRLSYED